MKAMAKNIPMRRLAPNTVLQDRFLLKEELSFEMREGQQTWAVLDRQTGQALIARLHADGRVEWFSDNRPPNAVLPATPPQPSGAQVSSVSTRSAGVPTTQRSVVFLFILLLLGGLLARYLYQEPLRAYRQSWYADSSAHIVSEIQPVSRGVGDSAATAPISAEQALRLLSLLRQIPAEKHTAIFADVRQAFVNLREMGRRPAYIDSLYTMCVGRGAQSGIAHQQNGDAVSKQYAVRWYQLAYALKPSPLLRERLKRLTETTTTPSGKRAGASKPARRPLFMTDPEVNR